MKRLVFATQNRHKAAELQSLLSSIEVEVVSLGEAGYPFEIVEDRPTFAGNAQKKAEEVARWIGGPALGDDSGLEVDVLNGQPGVWSARYAGVPSNDAANNAKLLEALHAVPAPRTARFRCALALAEPGTATQIEQGTCEGEILTVPRGSSGFGYDPLFLLPELGRTLAELSPAEKNQRSHRAQAMARMAVHLRGVLAR